VLVAFAVAAAADPVAPAAALLLLPPVMLPVVLMLSPVILVMTIAVADPRNQQWVVSRIGNEQPGSVLIWNGEFQMGGRTFRSDNSHESRWGL
jgi:hypothetical protein